MIIKLEERVSGLKDVIMVTRDREVSLNIGAIDYVKDVKQYNFTPCPDISLGYKSLRLVADILEKLEEEV